MLLCLITLSGKDIVLKRFSLVNTLLKEGAFIISVETRGLDRVGIRTLQSGFHQSDWWLKLNPFPPDLFGSLSAPDLQSRQRILNVN